MKGNDAGRLAVLALVATGASGFGFPPPEALICPAKTELRRVGTRGDLSHELHCARPDGTKHGPFRRSELGHREEGAYANGLQVGTWRAWYENGKPYWRRHYVAGRLEGLEIEWDENGAIDSRGSYRADKREGVWLDTDISASGRGRYRNDVREGPWSFRSDGHRIAAGAYRDGEPEGPWVYYWPGLGVESRGSFRRGEKHGLWRYYEPETDDRRVWLRIEIECRLGEAHGKYVELSAAGRIVNEGAFTDGHGIIGGPGPTFDGASLSSYEDWARNHCKIEDNDYRTARPDH